MDPEKINNVESKENEVSDKEAKTFQKVDPTDIDEDYEKNIKTPETTSPVRQLTLEQYNQRKADIERQNAEQRQKIEQEQKNKFEGILQDVVGKYENIIGTDAPITSMTMEQYKQEILQGSFKDLNDYINNSINGKEINVRQKKIDALKNIKNMLLSNTLAKQGLISFINNEDLNNLRSKIEKTLTQESLENSSVIKFEQRKAFIEVSPLLAQRESQRKLDEANEKANELFEKSKIEVTDSLNAIINGSGISGFKEVSQDNFLLIKDGQLKDYLIKYNKFIDDYGKINKDLSNREKRLNNRDNLDNERYGKFKKEYPKEKIQEIISSKQEEKKEMELKLGSIISNPKIDINTFMNQFVENQKEFIEKNTYVTKNQGEIIKTENPAIMIETTPQTQKVGEFIELSNSDKENISSQMNQLVEKDQEIVDIAIIGKADSTIPINEKVIDAQYKKSIESLIAKGFNINLLDNIEVINQEDFDNPDKYSDQQKYVNVLNQKRAFNRALMQIDFLSKEQIKKINESQNFTIIVDAQTVGDASKKGDQYTGGAINIDTKAGYKEEILPGNEIKISPDLIDIPQIDSDISPDIDDGQGNVQVNRHNNLDDKGKYAGNPDKVRVVSTKPSIEGTKKTRIYQIGSKVARDSNGLIKGESFVTGIIRDLKWKNSGAAARNPWAPRPGSRR